MRSSLNETTKLVATKNYIKGKESLPIRWQVAHWELPLNLFVFLQDVPNKDNSEPISSFWKWWAYNSKIRQSKIKKAIRLWMENCSVESHL